MKKTLKEYIAAILSEQVGRNKHTVDTSPNSWDSFQDFEIEYYPQDDGVCLMDVSFKGKKLIKTTRFQSYEDASHNARMIVDKHRVDFMNKS